VPTLRLVAVVSMVEAVVAEMVVEETAVGAAEHALSNMSINTDARVRPAAARPVHSCAGYLQRYAS
jgi:hypothetical protein